MDAASLHPSSGEYEPGYVPTPRRGSSSDESQFGPELKRQKVEESDHSEDAMRRSGSSSDIEIAEAEAEEDDWDDSSDDDDDDGRFDFASCFDFYARILDTEGAESRYPGHGFRHIRLDDPNEEAEHLKNVKRSARFVIYEQYRMGNKMKLVRIEKACSQSVNGYNYYITFSAETWPTRQIKVYQAQVYINFMGQLVKTTVFREKPPPQQQMQQPSGNTIQQVQGWACAA